MEKWEIGKNKKSFKLYYNGGEIWCEHLDSLEDKSEILREKLESDILNIKKPSQSAHIIIVLDETKITDEILNYILSSLINCGKIFRKIALVGLEKDFKRTIKKKDKILPFPICMFDDLEKAKEWVI